METVLNFPDPAQQKYENSCWACCSLMIHNFFHSTGRHVRGLEIYKDDDAITDAGRKKADKAADDKRRNGQSDNDAIRIGPTNEMGSASALLEILGYKNEIDENHIPSLIEIDDYLKENRPFVSLLTTKKPPDQNLGSINRPLAKVRIVPILGA